MPLGIKDLIKDPSEMLGRKMLISVEPAYKYENNEKTDILEGYNYVVFLPDKGHNKFNVKIKNTKPLFEVAEGGEVEVEFVDFGLYIWNNEIKGKATGVSATPQGASKSKPNISSPPTA